MPEIDPIILQLKAELKQYQNEIRATTTLVSKQLDIQERSIISLEHQIKESSGNIAASLRATAGTIATFFSAQQVSGLIDSYTRYENQLKTAGQSGQQLATTQKSLFDIAQRYGVELEAVATLYGRNAASAKELNLSQQDQLKITEATAAALKISGASAGESAGALLQLSQALGGTTIQAEEYNSLLDGARPLLQAVAAGNAKWGGSVAKLTADVKAGNVSVREFVDALLKGAPQVIEQAARANLTLSGSYTTLTNALTVYVGQAANANGATNAVATGIATLADNLDTVIPAIAVVGTALGVGFVVNAARAAAAAQGVGAAVLAAFGGPIGLTITALTVAVGAFAAESARTDAVLQRSRDSLKQMQDALGNTADKAKGAADGAKGVGTDALGAIPHVDAFAGRVGKLADELYRQARAARAARVETLQKQLSESQGLERDLGQQTAAGRQDARSKFRRGDFLNNAGVLYSAGVGSIKSLLSGGRTDREVAVQLAAQSKKSQDLQRQINEAKSAPITAADLGGTGSTATTADQKAITRHEATLAGLMKRKAEATGKELTQINARIAREQSIITDLKAGKSNTEATAGAPGTSVGNGAAEAKRKREEQQRNEREIADSNAMYVEELAATTRNAAEKADLDKRAITLTEQANALQINQNEALTEGQRAELLATNARIASLRRQQVEQAESDRLRQQALTISQEAMRSEDSLLQLQSGLAVTSAERRRIEQRRLELAQSMEKANIAEEIAAATIAGDTARIAAARKKLADLEAQAPLQREQINRETEAPGESYLRGIQNTKDGLNDALEGIQVDGLDALNRGLAEAISGARSLGDVFHNVAQQIVQDLLRIAIQQTVIKPLANALFGGSGGGGGGFLSSIAGLFGRASGGYVAPHQTVRVNEGASGGGVELLRMGSQGGTVVPLGQARTPATQGGGAVTVHVEASPYFDARVIHVASPSIAAMGTQAAAGGSQLGQADLARRAKYRLGR